MRERNSLLIFVLFFIQINVFSQYLWPIKGGNIGENIIFKPQDLIGSELNYNNLIISAEHGSEVLAPESGTIVFLSYIYYQNLQYVFTRKVFYKDTISVHDFDINQRKLMASGIPTDLKYISIFLMIQTKNGKKYSVSGLRPIKFFKTGSTIKKGDIIGTVGYVYNKIKEPAIMFSISERSKPVDPMNVFGLVSTFIPAGSDNNKINLLTHLHSPKELQEDYKIFCESLIEGHPGLYDYISKDELKQAMDRTLNELNKPMTSEQFRLKLAKIISLIRDSHTAIYSNRYKLTDGSRPPLLFGLNNDSLVVYSATKKYKDFIGKKIIKIDNVNTELIIPKIKAVLYQNDGFIETVKARKLFVNFWKYYGEITSKNKCDTLKLMFSDGSRYTFTYDNFNEKEYIPQLQKPFEDTIKVLSKTVAPKIAYLKINDFVLNDIERDYIKDFISRISDSSYIGLIIDVRDNLGGSEEIYKYIAQEPWQESIKQRVNKKGTYNLFKNCLNYGAQTKLFNNFIRCNSDSTFIIPKDSIPVNYPNNNVNFKGKVVILANEYSLSAATLVPALVHKYNRGKIVGRETGSCYYRMNAIIFPKVLLKNTGLELFFPLVQFDFDERGKSNIPWGRGVVPDITIPLSYDELLGNDDEFIKTAIEVINKPDSLFKNNIELILFLISIFSFVVIGIIVKRKYYDKKNEVE